jgi:uncharacterized protein (DUF1919 family)
MEYSFIGNNCEIVHLYRHYNKPYDTPFITSHIKSDHDFLKLCMHYKHYTSLEPVFLPDTEYPIMMLGDIVIDWYHYKTDKDVLDRYKRRLERQKNKTLVFLWGDMLLYDLHTSNDLSIIQKHFLTLDNSHYITHEQLLTERFEPEKVCGAETYDKYSGSHWKHFLRSIESR